jgi:mRNA interferase RelE/StbE
MRVEFKSSFTRDLKKIRGIRLKEKVRRVIELVERTDTLEEIANIRKLRGSDVYFRIRIGDYRIGIKLNGDTVSFVRILHRRDIYRYFP